MMKRSYPPMNNVAEQMPPPGANTQYNITALAGANRRGSLAIDGEIGYWGITAREVRESVESLGDVADLDVTINSPGGNIGEGIAIYNLLKKHPANVHISIEGYALSMGSVIAMAGDTVSMADNSLFMIHNTFGGAFGDADTLRKEAEVLDLHKEALINTYLARPQVALDRDAIWQAMQDETWYTAEMARDAGFVDQVVEVESEQVNSYAVNLPVASLQNAPEWVHMIRNAAVTRANAQPTPAAAGNIPEEDMNALQTTTAAPDTATAREAAAAVVTAQADTEAQALARENAAVVADRQRATDIRAEFDSRLQGHTMGETINHHINAGTSIETVRDIVNALVAAGAGASPAGGDAIVIEDQRDKNRAGMANAILVRAGMREQDGNNEYLGMTLYEMANASLRGSGAQLTGSRHQRVGAAFTHSTSDLPATLYDVAHQSLVLGYEEDQEMMTNHTRISRKGSMSDFRPQSRHGRGGFENLDHRPEGSEYKRGSLEFYKESNQLATYGKMFGMTREMIINDDIGAFTDIPAELGRAARRTVSSKFWDVFAANPTMADGIAWIHANHNNLNATATALTTDSVAAIRTAMALSKGRNAANPDMRPMGFRPNIMVVPAALEHRALLVRNNEYQVHANSTDDNRNANVVRNLFDVVVNSQLDEISTADWYMVYGGMPPVEMSYLDGNETPFLDQVQGWEIDGVEFKVRIDVGVSPMEFASIYKQAGV